MRVKQKPSLHASWIDPRAREIVERLQKSGFVCYLVGGCVRDLLVGIHPKDYDIATSASPQQVKKKVFNSYIIGRRFRLVLAKRGDQQYEISTFRREAKAEDFENLTEGDDIPSGDNFFGSPEEDAVRRDFTINALFYDPIKDELLDYVQALSDFEQRILRMIGDPTKRIIEDPIRSLRAIRLAHKINFKIEDSLRKSILQNADALKASLLPRRREEYLKFLRLSNPGLALIELFDLGLMQILLPTLHKLYENSEQREIFSLYMNRWSEFLKDDSNPSEIYAVLVWAFIQSQQTTFKLNDAAIQLLKDELGAFKTEIIVVENVFHLHDRLKEIDSFKKRGARRQQAFISNPELRLAVHFAKLDYTLSAKDLAFWQSCLD